VGEFGRQGIAPSQLRLQPAANRFGGAVAVRQRVEEAPLARRNRCLRAHQLLGKPRKLIEAAVGCPEFDNHILAIDISPLP